MDRIRLKKISIQWKEANDNFKVTHKKKTFQGCFDNNELLKSKTLFNLQFIEISNINANNNEKTWFYNYMKYKWE